MRKLIRIALVAVAAAALLLACEDKNAPALEEAKTEKSAAAAEPAEPAAPSAKELEGKYGDDTKKEATADSAEAR